MAYHLRELVNFQLPDTWEKMKTDLHQIYDSLSATLSIEGIAISSPGVVNNEKQRIEGISAIPYIHGFNIFEELEQLFLFTCDDRK